MKKIQKQKVDALTAFRNYCEENSIVWSLVVGFATAMTALGVKLQAILNMEGQQEKNNKGVTNTKGKTKRIMAESVVSVAEAIQGYATAVGNMNLYSLMQITYTDIYREKNSPSVSKANLVADTAEELGAVLEPYGVSDTVIEILRETIAAYVSVESSTRIVVTNKKNYTSNLDTLIGEGNTIMRKQLLKIGRQFKDTNPDFYAGMVNSAKVITTVVHTKLKMTVINAGDEQNPLSGCTVEIANTEQKAKTDTTGKCMISSVPEGTHTVIISKPGYVTLYIEDVQFIRGKSTTMTKALTPEFITAAVTTSKSKVNA